MASFPVLKTGAVAQYPLSLSTRYKTHEIRFLDGSRQTYQLQAGMLRRWEIALDRLDPNEVAAISAFAEAKLGDTFSFTDPFSGVTVEQCVIDGSGFEAQWFDEFRAKAKLVIREVR